MATHRWDERKGDPKKDKTAEATADPAVGAAIANEGKASPVGIKEYLGGVYGTYKEKGVAAATEKAIGWDGAAKAKESNAKTMAFLDTIDTSERESRWDKMTAKEKADFIKDAKENQVKVGEKFKGVWDTYEGSDKEKFGKISLKDEFYDKINHTIHMHMLSEHAGPTAAKAFAAGHELDGGLMALDGYPLQQLMGDSGTDMRNNMRGINAQAKGTSLDGLLDDMRKDGVFTEKYKGKYNGRTMGDLKEDWFGEHKKQRIASNGGVGDTRGLA